MKVPDLADLVRELHEVVEWFTLGIYLRINESQLLAIQYDHRGNTSECQTHMLIAWRNQENATWTQLVAALYQMNHRRLANEIARKYGDSLYYSGYLIFIIIVKFIY